MHKLQDVPQQQHAGSVFPSVVGIREVFTYISRTERAENRIYHRMAEDITVGMTEQSFFKRNIHSADNQASARYEPVRIIADAYPHKKPVAQKIGSAEDRKRKRKGIS
jgi:hypothetical protein